jgi:enoyl-CoA hydratase/carnithine racemase
MVVPTLAAVNGPAIGAGLNFALACDVIIAAESAYFDSAFLDIALHPGGGFLWRLQQAVGRQAAAAAVLFGERIGAAEAERLGLVWRVVPDAELADVAARMAARVAGCSDALVRRTKASLAASTSITSRQLAVDLELVAERWSMAQPAFAEGVTDLLDRIWPGQPGRRSAPVDG